MMNRAERMKMAKIRRGAAIARNELRQPSEDRQAAAGPTSLAVKVMDESSRRAIEEFLAKRKGA